MSKKNTLYGLSSQQLQQQYQEVCLRLGQEIGNERRAIDNQDTLKDQQVEIEKAYQAAKVREDEAAAQKATAKANTEAFEAKAKANAETAPQAASEAPAQTA